MLIIRIQQQSRPGLKLSRSPFAFIHLSNQPFPFFPSPRSPESGSISTKIKTWFLTRFLENLGQHRRRCCFSVRPHHRYQFFLARQMTQNFSSSETSDSALFRLHPLHVFIRDRRRSHHHIRFPHPLGRMPQSELHSPLHQPFRNFLQIRPTDFMSNIHQNFR